MEKQGAKVGRRYVPFTGQVSITNLRMTSQDIAAWKRAIDSARSVLNPRRKLLYELYENIRYDGHLSSVMQKRRMGITNKKPIYSIKDGDGEFDENVRDNIISTPWFHKMIGHLVDHIAWGHSLIELIPKEGIIADCVLVPRINVVPEKDFAALYPNTPDIGINYLEDPLYSKYMIPVGDKDNYGLLFTAAQYVIYKRGGFGDWAQFAELFGMPFRVGKYNPYDDSTRIKLEEGLKNMGGAAHAVIPDGTSIEFFDNNGAGKSEVFKDLVNICNSEMSKIFLGNTLTTDQGEKGARALGDVHEDAEEGVSLSDMIEMEYLLNWEFSSRMKLLGVPMKPGRYLYPQTEAIPLDKRLEMDVKLAALIPMSEEYFYDRYGVPKPDTNAIPVKVATKDGSTDEPPDKGKDKKKPPGKPTGSRNNPTAEAHDCCHDYRVFNGLLSGVEVSASALSEEEEALIKAIFENKTGKYDPNTLRQQIEKLKAGLQQHLPVDIAYGEPDYVAATWMEMNINRFGFDKNLATIQALNQALDNDETFDQFKAKANDILGLYNHTFLVTEYNLAIAVAQNASAWNRQKAQSKLFPFLKYQTVGDNNVRPAHAALDGKVFDISDTSWRDIYPPNGYNCRCEMIQLRGDEVFEPVTKGPEAKALLGPEYETMKKTGFAVNRGETKEVFDLNKAYIADLPKNEIPNISKLTYKDAGLPDYDTFKAGLKPIEKDLKATPESVLKLFGTKDTLLFNDYSGRPVSISRKTAEKHLSGKYISKDEERHHLFGNINEVLGQPSEVYVDEYKTGLYQYAFVRFYQDIMLLVQVRLNKEGMTIVSWYKGKAAEESLRKGFLVKKG